MESLEVLKLLKKIPKGKVTTYKILAEASGSRGCRAVGQILKRNPRPDLYLCYKVVKSDGSVGGFSGSDPNNVKKKIRLLESEGIKVRNNRVDLKKHLFRV